MAAMINPSINPPLLGSPVKRAPHPRSPSHSPVRQNYRDSDPLLRSLSPTTTLEAFSSDPQMVGQNGPLAVRIANASTSERTLGISAARACLDLRSWTRELENWDWPDTFDVPEPARKKMRLTTAETKNKIAPKFEMDDGQGEYWGSLPAKKVVSLEQRIAEIVTQRDKIDVEELKDFALNAHIGVESGRVSRNDTLANIGATSLDMRRLDDCTALITATVMQALPFLSRLNTLLDMWNIRLSILRAVPSYLYDLNNLKIDLDQGWSAIGQSRSTGHDHVEPTIFTRAMMKATKSKIEQQVQSLGTRLDGFLDTLEGRVETVPGNWIDEFESLETAYGDWVVDAERKVMRSEWQTARSVPSTTNTSHLTSDHTRNSSFQTISHFVEDHDRDGAAVTTPSSKPTKTSPVVVPAELSADPPSDGSTLTLPRSGDNNSENRRKKSPQRARHVEIDIDNLRSTYTNPSDIIPGDDTAPAEPVVETAKPQVQVQYPLKPFDLGSGPLPPTVKQRTNAFLNAEIERSNSLQRATRTPVRSFEHANNAFIRLFKKDKERSPGLYGVNGARNSIPARTSPNRMSRSNSTKDEPSSIPVRNREKSLSPVRAPRTDANRSGIPRHRSASPERRSMHDRRMIPTVNSTDGQSGVPRRPDSPLESANRPESIPLFPPRSTSLPRKSRGSTSPSPKPNARHSMDVSAHKANTAGKKLTDSQVQATPIPTRPPPAIPVDQIDVIAEEPTVAGAEIPTSDSAAAITLPSTESSLTINAQNPTTTTARTSLSRTDSIRSPLSDDFDISEGEIHEANAIEYSIVESSPTRSQSDTPTVRRPSSSHAAKLKLITSPGLLDPENKIPPRTILKRASCASIEIHPRSRVKSIDIGPRTPASARSMRSNSMTFSRSAPETPLEFSAPLSMLEPLTLDPPASDPIAPEALDHSVNSKSKLPLDSPQRRKINEGLGEVDVMASPGSPRSGDESGFGAQMSAPLNAAMKKRQSGMNELSGRHSLPPISPKRATQAPLVPEDSFDRHVSEVLDTLPAARIRFRQMNRPETPVSFRTDVRPRPKSRVSSGSNYAPSVNSGGMTITPAEMSPKKTASVVDPVKLYHLRTEGREDPIKLFVRLVGEGERVMVRVGGGWADLADYLKKYAEHHTSRTVSGSGPPLEVMSAEANGAGSTANLHRISVLSGNGTRKSSNGGWDPFGSASAAIRGGYLTSPPPLTPTGALSRLENRDDDTGEDFLGLPSASSPLEHEEPSSVKRSQGADEEEAAFTPQYDGSTTPIFETPSRPTTSSSSVSFSRSVASALPPHLRTPEVSLSGPAPASTQNRPKSTTNTELEQRKAKWVEGMIEQARASAEKAKSTATNEEASSIGGSGGKKKGLFREMGKIGGTRRVIFRSSAGPNTNPNLNTNT